MKERISIEPNELLQSRSNLFLSQRKTSLRVRYTYSGIFLVASLMAWFFRDYGQRFLPELHYIKACGRQGDECFQTMGVLRASLGCFIFFFILSLTTCKTTKLYQALNTWHCGWWGLKIVILIVSLAVPFFLSSDIIQLYGELARVGAGIFLLLQLISVIEFITWWNSYWMPDEKRKQSFGLFVSTLFYIGSICGILVMYPLYASKASCALNIFFISWTAVLLVVMMIISLHCKVNRGLLSSGIMASYLVFLCWSAIRRLGHHMTRLVSMSLSLPLKNATQTIRKIGDGFLIAVGAIVMATFSTGIDSQSFRFRRDETQLEDDIPYGYGFFHLVFSLGAMYFAMLFISWNLNQTAKKWSIDIGWASTWVKIVNEWFAATLYLCKLINPVVRQAKVMDQADTSQKIDSSDIP